MKYDDDSYCCYSETSEDFKFRQKKAAEDVRKLDKYYEKYSIQVKPYIDKNGRRRDRMFIENFGSGSTGTLIRNAVTGAKYTFTVGSLDEDVLFKVIDSAARNRRREPLMLYYDSPQQYENHHHTTVSQDTKQQWYDRSLSAQKRLEKH